MLEIDDKFSILDMSDEELDKYYELGAIREMIITEVPVGDFTAVLRIKTGPLGTDCNLKHNQEDFSAAKATVRKLVSAIESKLHLIDRDLYIGLDVDTREITFFEKVLYLDESFWQLK